MATPTFQQLRSASAGTHPPSLAPGQLAINTADNALYWGNGSNVGQLADGTNTLIAPPAGQGWIQFKLKAADLATAMTSGTTPAVVADSRGFAAPAVPAAGQILTWDPAANGGKGGYVPKTPGSVKVLSLTKTQADAGGPGSVTQAIVKALTTATAITGAGDLHAGDQAIVSDDKSAGILVAAGAYVWNGTAWLGLPSGGGATLMSQLTNVAVAPVAVTAANIAGVLVRDSSVANETAPGAWKVTTILDAGTF